MSEKSGPLDFDDYFRLFLSVHERPALRRAQLAATTAGIGCAVLGLFTRRLTLLVAAPVVAVLPPFLLGKALGERALPPGPGLRLVASLKLWAMTVSGTLEDERTSAADTDRTEGAPEETDESPHPAPNMVTDHTLH